MSFDVGGMVMCDHVDRYGKTYSGDELYLCPKCFGAGEYYDLSWSIVNGAINPIVDLTLLEELVVKGVLTIKGENPFHPVYGTSIMESIGVPLASPMSVTRLIEQEVSDSLAGVRARQKQQTSVGQYMSQDELIYAVSNLKVVVTDPRTIRVDMTIVAESGKEILISE